jgi:diguanylate cyclase (GGDEF)-like protein/PAS domain S-box-containing protein
MMPELFLTPSSISYLNQVLLAFIITTYLGLRFFAFSKHSSPQDRLLFHFFLVTTLFSLSLFLEVSLLSTGRLLVVYTQNAILGLMLVYLLQFAYNFPEPQPGQKLETRIIFWLSCVYAVWETVFAVWRFSLVQQGQVEFRPQWMDLPIVLEFLWVILVFARRAIQNWRQLGARQFMLTFSIPLLLAVVNLLRAFDLVSTSFYHISMSIGILFAMVLFTLYYLASKPESTSLSIRFSGVILASVLAVLGGVGWIVTPLYAAQYHPDLPDRRTLRFSPNASGGYDISQTALQFSNEFGNSLKIKNSTADQAASATFNFDFPFLGKIYHEVYVLEDGAVTFTQPLDYKDLEYRFSNLPAIFPLLIDLNPEISEGGVYARLGADNLLLTYYRLRAADNPQNEYTFQINLHKDGSFEISYNGLPADPQYIANNSPLARVWAIGYKPALAPLQTASLSSLPLSAGPQGLLQDSYHEFRQYLHNFLLPLVWGILASSLIFIIILPMAIHYNLSRPLNTLLAGVEQLNQGRRDLKIPLQGNDEIGFLTNFFNNMAAELDNLVAGLEERVADRTADLQDANDQLRKLSIAVEQSPNGVLITDLQARIEYVNPAFTQTTGYSFEEVRGQNPRLLKSGETAPELYINLWDTLTSGQTWRGELRNRRKNGELYWEYNVITPIRDESGQISHYVSAKEDITHRKLAEQELEHLVITDPLTSLFNRRYFFTNAEKIFTRSKFASHELIAMMLDIDRFKKVNDTYGHQAGDAILREAARRLQDSIRPGDLLARYGGEEFVLLLSGATAAHTQVIADRLIRCMREKPFQYNGTNIFVTISLGVACLTDQVTSLDELLSQADRALYLAKQQGRNRWVALEDTSQTEKV